jgi:hypothetical protein
MLVALPNPPLAQALPFSRKSYSQFRGLHRPRREAGALPGFTHLLRWFDSITPLFMGRKH